MTLADAQGLVQLADKFPIIDVRGRGLMCAVEFGGHDGSMTASPGVAAALTKAAGKRNMLLLVAGMLLISPAYRAEACCISVPDYDLHAKRAWPFCWVWQPSSQRRLASASCSSPMNGMIWLNLPHNLSALSVFCRMEIRAQDIIPMHGSFFL